MKQSHSALSFCTSKASKLSVIVFALSLSEKARALSQQGARAQGNFTADFHFFLSFFQAARGSARGRELQAYSLTLTLSYWFTTAVLTTDFTTDFTTRTCFEGARVDDIPPNLLARLCVRD